MGTEYLKIKEAKEAKKIIDNLFNELYKIKCEEILLENSYYRITYDNIKSSIAIPPFNKSLKDGFAVKAKDTFGASDDNPKTFKIIDTVEAGSFSEKTLKNGEAIEISTGAPVPKGSDAIAMVEYSEKVQDGPESEVAIYKSVSPSQDIAKKGSDIEKNKPLISAKTKLSPVKIGVLSAQGLNKVKVYKKLEISVISTGNELLTQEDTINYGKIYDINTNTIKNSVISCGCEAKVQGIIKDNYNKLRNKIETSLKTSDIVITSGGTSAGVGDVLKDVIEDIGEVIIHGISIKPGKPTLIGKVNGKLVIGLPGNPVGAIIVFNVFIAPNLRKLVGLNPAAKNKKIRVKLSKRIHSSKGRVQYLLIEIKDNKAYPILKDSGAINALSYAEGYIKVPKSVELIDADEIVEAYLF
ncbi:molybdenum cofactor synthesis domain-containing protein [Methanobrevibacter filiformis]|uniref:molybdopterin molybdotransferase n=1 Tax=Methanobrevibacter filiformis TaxID=55758 RepID=A0A166F5C8_9EURY|nr:gephyrin-like molybdotransferase Glp [Methanobrevibacter filiformis]KZX17332.1 molybdopterin molybdenumtransferase [Methanobrevibacter filiformis]